MARPAGKPALSLGGAKNYFGNPKQSKPEITPQARPVCLGKPREVLPTGR